MDAFRQLQDALWPLQLSDRPAIDSIDPDARRGRFDAQIDEADIMPCGERFFLGDEDDSDAAVLVCPWSGVSGGLWEEASREQ
jgi:hypothetical protein